MMHLFFLFVMFFTLIFDEACVDFSKRFKEFKHEKCSEDSYNTSKLLDKILTNYSSAIRPSK